MFIPQEGVMKTTKLLSVIVAGVVVMICAGMNVFAQNIVFPKIDRHPIAADYHRGKLDSIPAYNPASTDPFKVDLRGYDLSELDLSGSFESLLNADFDDRTIWPSDDRMPGDYNREVIMELGKNPGLGIRSLHDHSVTGRGVGIAIIDQPLLVEHTEYVEQLRLYEEINIDSTTEAQMHGPAVASIACGKTIGVAPEADLYYIACRPGFYDENQIFHYDFTYHAQAVRRILEINRQLPSDHKIRVISISVGWNTSQDGYTEMTAAVNEAKAAGMLVVCSSIEEVHGFKFHGLGREPLDDPESSESFLPGRWWEQAFFNGYPYSDCLKIPMDSRATASPTGDDEYVFYRDGGWSWSIPYIAGVYALAAQVNPAVTPEQFWDIAMSTGRWRDVTSDSGATVSLGPIIDPPAIIEELEISISPGVESEDTNPGLFMLHNPYPNPFNPSTTISYQIHEKTRVNLTVFTLNGQVVKTMVDNEEEAGYHSVIWYGTDSSGMKVASGIYLYRLKAGDFSKTQKMTFVR